MPQLAIIVPARLLSTRFPRKLLHPIRGKPLILWTAERLRAEADGIPVYFAVDGPELAEVLRQAGENIVMTDPSLPSGTDRIAAANREIRAEFVLNIQADEPLVSAGHISVLASLIRRAGVVMATLSVPFSSREDFLNPSQVKVVMGMDGRALYFSRSPIPCDRDSDPSGWPEGTSYRHLGMYAYTADFLEKFQSLPVGNLERLEKLEQLRALENGYSIQVGIASEASIGVDTREDADRLEALISDRAE